MAWFSLALLGAFATGCVDEDPADPARAANEELADKAAAAKAAHEALRETLPDQPLQSFPSVGVKIRAPQGWTVQARDERFEGQIKIAGKPGLLLLGTEKTDSDLDDFMKDKLAKLLTEGNTLVRAGPGTFLGERARWILIDSSDRVPLRSLFYFVVAGDEAIRLHFANARGIFDDDLARAVAASAERL